jgi:hypothetical protein
MTETTLGVVGACIVGLITGLVSYLVARQNGRASDVSGRTAPYDSLARRVSELETADEAKSRVLGELRQQMADVVEDRNQMAEYIGAWWLWWHEGAPPPPPPVPATLWDVIPPTVWQQQTPTPTEET